MNIIKKTTLEINHDLFPLVILKDFIVCSSEDQDLKVFDKSLKRLENIFLINDMLVDRTYKNFLKNEVILYSHDNACLIWINIVTRSYKVVPIDIISHDFTQIYCWIDDYVIFVTYDAQYYKFDIKKGVLYLINYSFVKDKCLQLGILFNMYKPDCVSRLENGYIVKDYRDGSLVSIITPDSIRKVDPPAFPYHNVVYAYGKVVFVGETKIQVVNESNQIFILLPQKGYNFLIVEPRQDGQRLELVVLSGYLPDHRYSLINVYGVCN